MDKVYGNPTVTPFNVQNFVGKASSINNKASGKSIFLADSSENKLNNLIVYGKTTQAAEPTLDAPQELVSIGAEPFDVFVTGNNLFNPLCISTSNIQYETLKPKYEPTLKNNYGTRINSVTYDNEVGIIAIQEDTKMDNETPVADITKGFLYIYFDNPNPYHKFGQTYTFIADIEVLENKSSNNDMRINIRSGGNNFQYLTDIKSRFCTKINATQNATYPYRHIIEFHTIGKSLHLKNIMWLEGDWTANPPEYEDYKEQVLTIEAKKTMGNGDNLTGLVAVPVKSGGNYTDASGQSWIANTIDFKDGKHYKRVWARLLPSSGWYQNNVADDGDLIYQCDTEWPYGHSEVLCSHFPCKSISTTTEGQGIWATNNNGYITLWIKAPIDNIEEFIATNRPYVYYANPNVVGTKLSDAELDKYKSLLTNYPTTRVINAVDAGMEVEYVADTKNYIDNKFAELTALVLEG